MPMFNTGNAEWDQGFNTLASGLFPDPSKVAQAGYYGAEARKAQFDAAKSKEQLAAGHYLLGMTNGQQMRPPTTSASGPLDIQTLNEPQAPPGPPPNPPTLGGMMANSAAAPAPGPAPGPPAAGQVGAGMDPASLGSLVAQGGGPVPTASPSAIGDAVTTAVANSPGAPGPAVAPPVPGAAPAPNTTGSDGSVPASPDHSMLHPATFTPAGGGVKQSGPAAPDGSPAPVGFNLGQFAALAALKGLPADQANQLGQAIVAGWVKNGQMDQTTAERIVAFMGQPQMRNTAIQGENQLANTRLTEAGATGRTILTEAGATGRTKLVEAGANQRAEATIAEQDRARGDALVEVSRNNVKTMVPRRDLRPDEQGYDATLANTKQTQQGAAIETQPGGPGTPPISQTVLQAQTERTPLYQPSVANTLQTQRGATGTYIDLANPTQLIPATFDEAKAKGLVAAPTTTDGWTALASSAAVNARTPDEAQAIRDKVMALSNMQPPKQLTPSETVQNENIIDAQLDKQLPVPVGEFPGYNMATNTLPAGSSPELGVTLSDLTDQYFTRSTDPAIRNNRVAAANAAIKQLIQAGMINPQQDRGLGLTGQTTINKGVYNKDTKSIEPQPRFRVDLLNPETKQPYPPGQPPKVRMTGSLANAVTPDAAAAKPIGTAPPGTPDGKRVQLPDGTIGRSRGGMVYAE